jgi:cation transport regulator ChaC
VPLLVFAYGSLLFRPSRFFGERRAARLRGYRRAFQQASTDHRGTPDAPGRVVTLLHDPGATCGGAVYAVDDARADEALAELDDRESGGYDRADVVVEIRGEAAPARALTWIAHPTNANHRLDAPLASVAEVVRRARGLSGTNVDYVIRLARALREMDWHDPHVLDLEALVVEP